MVGDSYTWWKAVGNELGRLGNGIDNRVRQQAQYNLSERKKYQKVAWSHENLICD